LDNWDDDEGSSSGQTSTGGTSNPQVFPMSTVMLANKFKPDNANHQKKVIGWLMSEKLDGLRAVWTGEVFFSRSKIKYETPQEFVVDFPKDLVLDGELFCGAGNFSTATSLVRRSDSTYQDYLNGMYLLLY
jgi:ATP-dependent DNA ligase